MAGFCDRVNEITINKNVNYGIIIRMEEREEENQILPTVWVWVFL